MDILLRIDYLIETKKEKKTSLFSSLFRLRENKNFFLCFYCMYINLELLIYNDDDAELVAIYNIARGLLFIWIINACKSIISASCVRIELNYIDLYEALRVGCFAFGKQKIVFFFLSLI